MRTLNKLIGALLGILYPLKSLLINALFLCFQIGLALAGLVLSPLILLGLSIASPVLAFLAGFAIYKQDAFYPSNFSSAMNGLKFGVIAAVITLLLFPVALITVPLFWIPLAFFAASGLTLFFGARDFFSLFKVGVKEGYKEGLFSSHVLERLVLDIRFFSFPLRWTISKLSGSKYKDRYERNDVDLGDISNPPAFNPINFGDDFGPKNNIFNSMGMPFKSYAAAAPVSGFYNIVGNGAQGINQNPIIIDNPPNNPARLVKLKKEAVIQAYQGAITTLFDPLNKEQIKSAKMQNDKSVRKLVNQYEKLHAKLSDLTKSGIIWQDSNGKDLDDELDEGEPIKTPTLLVKEYFDGESWRAVPGSTKITNREHVLEYLKVPGLIHPILKVALDKPRPYTDENQDVNLQVRYQFYVYDGLGSCKELIDAADTIRNKLELNNSFSSDSYSSSSESESEDGFRQWKKPNMIIIHPSKKHSFFSDYEDDDYSSSDSDDEYSSSSESSNSNSSSSESSNSNSSSSESSNSSSSSSDSDSSNSSSSESDNSNSSSSESDNSNSSSSESDNSDADDGHRSSFTF